MCLRETEFQGEPNLEHTTQNIVETNRFKAEDVLFSMTDKRGVIKSVNDAFCRITDMPREDVINAPHSIIRHPEMPHAVFNLVWNALQKGEPIGAYLVNQTKDQQAFWAYVVFLPAENGFVAVSIKPSAKRLDRIKELYAKLRLAENNENGKPEDCDAALIKGIIDQDCRTYEEFMSRALAEEMVARSIELDRDQSVELSALAVIQSASNNVVTLTKDVHRLFQQTTQVPFNMRLQAIRMEGRDGPIGVISSNHQVMTQKLETQVSELRVVAERGQGPISDSQFAAGIKTLLDDLEDQFLIERDAVAENSNAEVDIVKTLCQRFEQKAHQAALETANRSRELSGLCKNFKRSMSSLELTRIMCKIEQARFVGDGSGLEAIAEELMKTEKSFSEGIVNIESLVQEITTRVKQLSGPASEAA